ncbi:MAG: nitrile hydratase accessory protein [Pseudomonadales bacterium]|nr:nitrile hydratase accessory protein [Pseudomonadales bacterium]
MLRIPDAGAAPPLRNGELDFEAPWQGRVFAMANALCEAGVFEWQEFQTALIRVIASSPVAEGQPYQYYNLFLAALESLLADKSVLRQQTIGQLVAELAAREHGHDH